MRLEGTLIKGSRRYHIMSVEVEDREDIPFSRRLDAALLKLCKSMGAPLPIWLSKNTREFSRFHSTVFFPEQYAEKTPFDQFQIRLYEESGTDGDSEFFDERGAGEDS